jgi:hypothetical protein
VRKQLILEILLFAGLLVGTAFGQSLNEQLIREISVMDKANIEGLIAKGADINARDNHGETPLFTAACCTSKEVVELLLAKGADINVKDYQGWTPLWQAVNNQQKEIVELLIAKGADVTVKNEDGKTLLQWAGSVSGNLYKEEKEKANREIESILLAASTTGNSAGDIQKLLTEFKGHSENEELRAAIINLALKQRSIIAPDAEAAAGRGTYIFKNAKSPDEVLSAAKEYLAAIEAAPWVANYYFNLCTVLEKTPYTQQAVHACKLYLVAAPDASDAGAVRQRIAGLQYAADRDKAQMKQRTRFIGTVSLDDLYRSGGISGTVSGSNVVLKLFVDWSASPPKYQAYAGCFKSDGVKGGTHDLVSTDTWFSFCNHAFNLHLLIKPEGEGFVEMSDSNGGSLRATLNELFSAKQKTMSQSLLFSANGDRGDQFYIPYSQGGNDMKHAGFAMYASDCNGDILKKDPRALPDDFIPADKFAAGDYGRFTPEVDSYPTQPKSDVCTRDFAIKTGYRFGEAE